MRITDIQVVRFRTTSRVWPARWGYSVWGDEHPTVESVARIMTDEGIEGYNLGGGQATMEWVAEPLLVGENPLGRESHPLDSDGNVVLTTKPGLGMEFLWD